MAAFFFFGWRNMGVAMPEDIASDRQASGQEDIAPDEHEEDIVEILGLRQAENDEDFGRKKNNQDFLEERSPREFLGEVKCGTDGEDPEESKGEIEEVVVFGKAEEGEPLHLLADEEKGGESEYQREEGEHA